MERKNSLLLLVIAIATLIAVTLLATFAYFATSMDVNANIPVGVETANGTYAFTASGSGEINMYISSIDMSQANVSTEYIKNDSANILVTLASPTDDITTTCTYDIIWVWDSDDKYIEPDDELPIINGDKTYPYEFSTKINDEDEKVLSTLPLGKTENSIIMQQNASIISTSTEAISKNYVIDAQIYNLPIIQENLFDKGFRAHITIENVNCTMKDTKEKE